MRLKAVVSSYSNFPCFSPCPALAGRGRGVSCRPPAFSPQAQPLTSTAAQGPRLPRGLSNAKMLQYVPGRAKQRLGPWHLPRPQGPLCGAGGGCMRSAPGQSLKDTSGSARPLPPEASSLRTLTSPESGGDRPSPLLPPQPRLVPAHLTGTISGVFFLPTSTSSSTRCCHTSSGSKLTSNSRFPRERITVPFTEASHA